jgi:hypothetical protein
MMPDRAKKATMRKKQPSAADLTAEIAKLDLRPAGEANKRTDDLLRNMFNTPPDPFTHKPKKKAKSKG